MEPTHKLDVLGHYCPVPVNQARNALQKLKPGEILLVVADDPETTHDIPLLVNRMGHTLLVTLEDSGEFHYTIEVKQ